MALSQAKENILKIIRQAVSHPVPFPFPQSEGAQSVFHPAADDLAVTFAENFTRLQGRFAFCSDDQDLRSQLFGLVRSQNWKNIYFRDPGIAELLGTKSYPDLATCDVSVTLCECLVARTGTIVLSAALAGGRTTSVYAPVHICIASAAQVFFDLKDALQFLKEKYGADLPSQISFATGPSRTADIEKTLVTGVHGPKEVYCFLREA